MLNLVLAVIGGDAVGLLLTLRAQKGDDEADVALTGSRF